MGRFCPGCGAAMPQGATFCPACGMKTDAPPAQPNAAPVPNAVPPGAPQQQRAAGSATAATGSGPELRICAGCGAIAPVQRSDCECCKGSLASPAIVHDASSGFWVGVECGFTCHVCGHFSPLNYLENDGDVQCLRCGIEQRFDRGQWVEGLSLAHAVGDLGGPAPEGRFPLPGAPSIANENPYKNIGSDKTFAEDQQHGMSVDDSGVRQPTLQLRAMPGHPLCDKCKQPRRVTACAGGELSLECPGCHDARTYVRPDHIPESLHALAGVVAMEHEKGGQHANVEQDASGAVAIRCPNCSAPLDFDGKSTVIRCKFCDIAVRIPSRTLRSLGQEHPQQLRWWLCFSDVSDQRKKLAQQAQAQAEQERQRAEWRARSAQGTASAQQRPQKSSGLRAALILPFALAVVALGAGLTLYLHEHSQQSSSTTSHSRRASVAHKSTATVKNPYPELEAHWVAKVTKASGVSLKRGEKCDIYARLQGPKVHWVTVHCGHESIYDSRVQASGMINSRWGVAEEPAKGHPGAYAYAIKFTSTGQFSGRPQASIDTTAGQGVIFSTVLPVMRVEMKIPEASLPRVGAPMFHTPESAPRVQWKATVTAVTGGAPVKTGTNCSLDVAFADSQAKATACDATVRCGRHWLYGTKQDAGVGVCKIDGSGRPLTIQDKLPATQDHTPLFNYDASSKTASVDSKDDGYSVSLRLSH